MTRHDVSTADLLGTGLCYADVIQSLDASGGKITATYEEAVAVMELWAEQSGRESDLHDGMEWLRTHFDDDYAPPPPQRRRWWTTRSKFGSGRPRFARSNDQSNFMRIPRGGVALLQNREPGRGPGRA